MNAVRAQSLSQRERVSAERTGEGLRRVSHCALLRLRRTFESPNPLARRLRRHPLPLGEGRHVALCRAARVKGAQAMNAPRAQSLSHGERVSAKRTGEGLRRLSFRSLVGLRRASDSPNPLTRRLWRRPFPLGEGLKRVPSRLWGARRAGFCDIDRATNFLNDPVHALVDLSVCETPFEIPMRLDRLCSQSILFDLFSMMRAVDLDCQSNFNAAKISDESCDRNLTAKLQTFESPVAQLLPQIFFGARFVSAEFAGKFGQFAHVKESASYSGRAQSLSHRERVAAKRTGEGLRRWSSRSLVGLRRNSDSPYPLTRRLWRHPLPQGEGLRACSP